MVLIIVSQVIRACTILFAGHAPSRKGSQALIGILQYMTSI